MYEVPASTRLSYVRSAHLNSFSVVARIHLLDYERLVTLDEAIERKADTFTM